MKKKILDKLHKNCTLLHVHVLRHLLTKKQFNIKISL